MPVDLLIKDVPDDVAERLRLAAAAMNHSVNDELLEMLIHTVGDGPIRTPQAIFDEGRARGTSSPPSSVAMIREDRDSR